MTGTEISFLRPEVLWYLPMAALAVLAWLLIRRRRFVAFSAVRQLQLLRHRPSPLRGLPRLLLALALALTLLALMEPVLPYSESAIEAEGLDIVLVLDLSSSMEEPIGGFEEGEAGVQRAGFPARLPPGGETRLAVTKRALIDFVKRRRDDRIGLVVFSDNAYVISPLTFDYVYLLQYVDAIDSRLLRLEGLTAIGEGIHMASVLLSKQSDPDVKNEVIVVLTDGEHNIGRDPIDALGDASRAGMRVHLIGVDLEEYAKRPRVAKLVDAVVHYGGRYYEASSESQLQAANAALATIEKGRLAGRLFERNLPIYAWFALPALILIVAAFGLRTIPYFTDLT